MARFSVCKEWLKPDIERIVWYYAFVHPTAKAMKDLTIESEPRGQWVRKTLKAEGELCILSYVGRRYVNPCPNCSLAQMSGMGGRCGQCRSRPIVFRTNRLVILGTGRFQRMLGSPRDNYLRLNGWL